METTKILIGIAIGLAAIVAIAIGAVKLFIKYTEAVLYSELSPLNRIALRIGDYRQYKQLRDSYIMIKDLPFIGETL